jgi:hypothetical protein
MNNNQKMAAALKKMSGQEGMLAVPRVYVDLTGDVEAALFLSQCVYWSDRSGNSYGFYESNKNWQAKLGLSKRKIIRCTKVCSPWVSTSLHRANGAPTLHYKVNFSKLMQDVLDLPETSKSDLPETSKSDLPETSKSLTKTPLILPNIAEPTAPTKALTEAQLAQARLMAIFTSRTGLPEPDHKAKEFVFLWARPTAIITKIANGQSELCWTRAIDAAQGAGLTISDPNSILKMAKGEWSKLHVQAEQKKDNHGLPKGLHERF